MPTFERDLVLQAPLEHVFDFLIQLENVVKLSPPEMGLKLIQAPERYAADVEVEFAVQSFGMVQKVTHRITEFSSPERFIEELIQGPVPKWVHIHEFHPVSETETKVIDRIEFEPPGGLTGMLLTANKIQDHLEDAFFYRHQKLEKLITP